MLGCSIYQCIRGLLHTVLFHLVTLFQWSSILICCCQHGTQPVTIVIPDSNMKILVCECIMGLYVMLPGLIFLVPVTGQHFWVLVCSHQWGWHVCDILHHVLQVADALVVQSHIPLLFHLTLHLRGDQLVHFCYHGCLRHNQGKQNYDGL